MNTKGKKRKEIREAEEIQRLIICGVLLSYFYL
jgi:hypothetical protein